MSSFVYLFLGGINTLVVGPTTLMAIMSSPWTSNHIGNAPLLALANGIVIWTSGLLKLGNHCPFSFLGLIGKRSLFISFLWYFFTFTIVNHSVKSFAKSATH